MYTINEEALPRQAIIHIDENPLIVHISHMRCGSYTAEWIARAMGMEAKNSNDVLVGPLWYDYLRPILPLTVLGLLKKQSLEGFVVLMDQFMGTEQKINWLKKEIVTKKKPILILIKATTLHWVVIAGYDDEEGAFYMYDPNFGPTSINTDVPVGNKKVNYERLLDQWSGRWNFRYLAVVILNHYVMKEQVGPNPLSIADPVVI